MSRLLVLVLGALVLLAVIALLLGHAGAAVAFGLFAAAIAIAYLVVTLGGRPR